MVTAAAVAAAALGALSAAVLPFTAIPSVPGAPAAADTMPLGEATPQDEVCTADTGSMDTDPHLFFLGFFLRVEDSPLVISAAALASCAAV